MRDLNIYIANCYFYEGKKISLDISPYVANSEIKITYANNNIIPTLENLTCEFFNNIELMSEVIGLYDFIKNHKDFSLFSIIVKHNNSIIFNGFIELFSLDILGNYRFTQEKSMKYSLDSIIHKSSELKNKYISKIISYKNIDLKTYFNYLFETTNKITKYIEVIDNISTPFEDLMWGLEKNGVLWGNFIKDLYWGFDGFINNYFIINKSKCYNPNLIMVGDSLHLATTDKDNITTYQSHVIKNVYKYFEDSEIEIIESIEFYDKAEFSTDIMINIKQDYSLTLSTNNIIIGTGTVDPTSLKCEFSGLHSGKIIFKYDTYPLVKKYLGVLWGRAVSDVYWGLEYANVYWELGYVTTINMTNLKVETFTDIELKANSTIKAYIGYNVNTIDDTKDIIVSNPIIKFTPAMNLIDDMASDYLFNYSVTNSGNILLYTDTSDTLENEDYILQIGNNPYNLLYNSSIILNNSILSVATEDFNLESYNLYWGFPVENILWDNAVSGLYWGFDKFVFSINDMQNIENQLVLTPVDINLDYNCTFRINGLVAGRRYIFNIDSNANNIELKCNNLDLPLEQIDYYDEPTFTFTMPEGQDTIDVILSGNAGVNSIIIEKITIYEYVWTDSEYDSVFSPLNISIDSTGLKTATNVTNFSQTQESEFIEQISSINPAINTYHKLLETPFESTKTYSTGGGDKKYIQLGRDLPSITFPILLDEESTFINKLSINTFRNTLTTQMCLLASFVKNSSKYIFNQIIPYSQIETSSLTLTPAFINKKVDDKLECIIKPMIYETGKIITSNSFTTTNSQYYIIGEKIIIPNNSGGLDYYTIQDVVGNTITLTESIINGTYDILVDKNNTVTGEYLELEINTNFVDTGDYIILGDIQNTSLQLVRDVTIQNSYVSRYPIENIGNGYNGVPNQIFLLDEDILTDTFKLVDLSGNNATGISFINANEDYFQPLLDYNLVYIEIFNYSTNKWEVYKLDSYNKINGTITITENLNLTDYSSNNICQFRRIYITTTTGFEAKPTDDSIYEAYITSDRHSFGFNYKVDSEAIQYLINGDTTKTKGKIYDVGNILTAIYNVSLTFPRYLEDFNSVNKYGIIEDVFSDKIETNENYVSISQNQLKYNSEPVVKTDVTIHLGYLSIVRPDVDLTKIQLIRLYHEVLPYNGLYAINTKQFSFKKSGIHTCKLSLEKIVGV